MLSGSSRLARTVCAIAALMAASACGTSSQTSIAPSTVRCAVQGQADASSFPADGGSGTLQVSTNRECAWTVQSDSAWLVLPQQAGGQGDGSVRFTVSPNGDPSGRTAALSVNDQRMQIAQAGRPCELRLSSAQESVSPAGGQVTITVQASSSQCTWSASSDVPWVTIVEGQTRSGSGAVVLQVAAAAGPPRTGTLTIAGQRVTIEQGTGCTFAVGLTAINVSPSGGRAEVPVTAPPGCAWTATSNAPWITIIGGQSGAGNGAAVFQVAATNGPPRKGTLTVAGRTVTIDQGSGCTFATGVTTLSVSASGGRAEVPVAAPPGCAWTAASGVPWITIAGGETGAGNGTVVLQVAAATGPARTGTVTVAGQNVRVEQASACTFATGGTAFNVGAAGGGFDIPVTAPPGCTWTAVSGAPWIEIASGASGNGSAAVRVSVPASDGPQRTGTLTVAGVRVTVTQASGCRYSVEPSSYGAPPGGGSSSVTVQAGAGCPWDAASGAPWISLSQTSGAGPAQVPFTVAANNGPDRSGEVTIAGRTVTVTQPSPCIWSLVPRSMDFDANGGNGAALVIVVGPCAWTASSTVDWITMQSGTSGAGNGLVQFVVSPNAGSARSGIVRIADMDLTVRQAAR